MSAVKAIADHVVEVTVETAGGTRFARPPAQDKIQVQPGESIAWVLHNETDALLALGVGNFRAPDAANLPHPGHLDEDREVPIELLAGGWGLYAYVRPKETATVMGRIKPGAMRRRTYKYDVIEFQSLRVLLDPHIEVG